MARKKRILFVNNSSLLGIGTSKSLLSLIKYLHKEFNCSVVSDNQSSQLAYALKEYDVPYYAFRGGRFFVYLYLIALILWGRFDIVYANGTCAKTRAAFKAAKICHRPFIWHIRGLASSVSRTNTIQLADIVFANSQNTAERLRKYGNVANPIVINNGVDIEMFDRDRILARNIISAELGINPDWLRVVNLGTIVKYKNQEDFIVVASRVLEQNPEIYFIIRGNIMDVDYYHYLLKMIEEKKLGSNIYIYDYTQNIYDFLCGSDILLHTSIREAQGRTILEAMAARLPVVAYHVGGVGESIVDGKTGFLLPQGDVKGLTRAANLLIGDAEARREMGEAGFQRVAHSYTAEMSANMVREAIKTILS